MKIVIGIILIVLIMAGIGLYVVFMLNAHDLVYCGDIKGENGSQCYVTRVYTADLNANETLSQIVSAMNQNESGNLTAEEMARRYTPQICSRLEGEFTHLPFAGTDIRKLKKEM